MEKSIERPIGGGVLGIDTAARPKSVRILSVATAPSSSSAQDVIPQNTSNQLNKLDVRRIEL